MADDNSLALNLQHIGVFAAGFGALFVVVDQVTRRLSSRVAAKSRREQVEFSSYSVSSVHALVCFALNLRVLLPGGALHAVFSDPANLAYFAYSEAHRAALRFTLGYFVYDCLLMLWAGGYSAMYYVHHLGPIVGWPFFLANNFAQSVRARRRGRAGGG